MRRSCQGPERSPSSLAAFSFKYGAAIWEGRTAQSGHGNSVYWPGHDVTWASRFFFPGAAQNNHDCLIGGGWHLQDATGVVT